MSSSQSFSSIYNLANLTAPASGVTHSAKWAIGIVSGQSVTLNMLSQMEFLGDFIGQSIMVDNTANTVDLTITETTYGWVRTIQGGTMRVFQYPACENQNFIFSAAGNLNIVFSVFDWPAFPDEAFIAANAGGTPVIVVGTVDVDVVNTVTVTGTVDAITAQGTAAAGTNTAVATGGTAVAVFADMLNAGAFVTNPNAATESLFVDAVNNADTAAPGTNGTTIELVAGQSQEFPAMTGTVTVNAITNGHTFTAVTFG